MKSEWKNDLRVMLMGVAIFLALELALFLSNLFLDAAQNQYPTLFAVLGSLGKILFVGYCVFLFARWFYRNVIRNQDV